MIDQDWTIEEIKDEVAADVLGYEREKIREWLKKEGYDGLWHEDGEPHCGCILDDFAPCGEGPLEDCVAAHKREDGMYPGRRI